MRDLKGLTARHILSALCLLFLFAGTLNAYSIVMRGGKRIEIPDEFQVTPLTLTYETAPGFWITLQMAAVDVPATERANNERPGSLLGRAMKTKAPAPSESSGIGCEGKAQRSVTNRDLESFGRQRLESERVYEQRLKESGLPPLAELRAQAAERAERFWQEMAKKRQEAEANERITQLQAEIAVLNAQLNNLHNRLERSSLPATDAFVVFGGFPFFDSFGRSKVHPSLFDVPPGVPIGGAFGSLNIPFGSRFQFNRGRRNIFVAPGTQSGGRRFSGRRHGGGRSH